MVEQVVGPTSHYYYSQRLKLHYVDWGNITAPPLLLIHGGRDHARTWDWVAQALRDSYHIIAPDLRGHGDSEWARGSQYAMIDYVLDIAQLLEQLQWFPMTIIGHSLGGGVACQYTGVYPERVKRLVAIEGLGPHVDVAGMGRRTSACMSGLTRCAPMLGVMRVTMPRWTRRCSACRMPTNGSLPSRRIT